MGPTIRELRAIHVAAHAVVQVAKGLTIERVFLDRSSSSAAGVVHSPPDNYSIGDSSCPGVRVQVRDVKTRDPLNEGIRRSIARSMVLADCAGCEAERFVFPKHADKEWSTADLASAIKLSLHYELCPRHHDEAARHAYLRRVHAEARREVKAHWQAIRALFLHLLQHNEADYATVAKLIRSASKGAKAHAETLSSGGARKESARD
jgi:hypothetical protein